MVFVCAFYLSELSDPRSFSEEYSSDASVMETDSVLLGDAVAFGVALMLPLTCLGARAYFTYSPDGPTAQAIRVVRGTHIFGGISLCVYFVYVTLFVPRWLSPG
jgi:hypothetical protein